MGLGSNVDVERQEAEWNEEAEQNNNDISEVNKVIEDSEDDAPSNN